MSGGEAWAIVLATFLGPVAAIAISDWRNRRLERRDREVDVFRTLMATRRVPISLDHVRALNIVEVVFHGVEPIETAHQEYVDHLNAHPGYQTEQAKQQVWEDRRGDLLAVLISKIASHLKIVKSDLEIRRGGYAPDGWFFRDARQVLMTQYVLDLAEGRKALPVVGWQSNKAAT